MAKQEQWGEEELEKRDQYLTQCALAIWAWTPVKEKNNINQLSFLELPL